MAGKFEISNRSNGEFQFNLKAGNGQVILSSEGYKSLPACQMGVESVRMHSVNPTHFECKIAKDGSPYFSQCVRRRRHQSDRLIHHNLIVDEARPRAGLYRCRPPR